MNTAGIFNSRVILSVLIVLQVAAFGILIWGPQSDRKVFFLIFLAATSIVTVIRLLKSFKEGYSSSTSQNKI